MTEAFIRSTRIRARVRSRQTKVSTLSLLVRDPYLFACGIDVTSASSPKPIFEIPTIREYFMDLDYILSVISDGPAKSYAYHRLKYLSGKWAMYMLLNEDEEIASVKVGAYLK
jgi:hypothetical protein